MKKMALFAGSIIILLVLSFVIFNDNENGGGKELLAKVEKADFEIRVITTGELEAKNSEEIMGPIGLRDFRIRQVTIESIAEEGTEVKKGDWIATLDPTELSEKIIEQQIDLDNRESQYKQTQLDTALQMRQARDELINLKYAVEERQIVLEQSQFEPPATIKQAEINVDKAKRSYRQAQDSYKIRLQQNIAKMRIAGGSLNKARKEYEEMIKLRQALKIRAPEDGMLIYEKGRDGRPIKEGSQIGGWNPVVATLPDLSVMLSKTYVNEVDVRKVKVDQKVDIGLDAFPEKNLRGKVIRVANVGEQRPNGDAKVFQVDIQIATSDQLLKPGMTTSNEIITSNIPEALQLSLECLHNQGDSITFVYVKNGLNVSKQEVIVGEINTDNAIILAGLEEGDRIYLSEPQNVEDESINLLSVKDTKNKQEVEAEDIDVKPIPEDKANVKRKRKKARERESL